MRKVILILSAVLGLLVLAGGIFCLTFNADSYRPVLMDKIEAATGKKVDMEHLSLVWKNGIALKMSGFKLHSESGSDVPGGAEFDSVTAVIRLWPLLQKNIQVVSVVLTKPSVDIERGPEGVIRVAGIAGAGVPSGEAASSSGGPSGISLAIDSILIEQGQIRWRDRASTPPMDLALKDLSVTVKNFSLTQPFAFEARGAVLSGKQNIFMSGFLQLPEAGKPPRLQNFLIKSDLSLLSLSALTFLFPSVEAIGLNPPLSGQVQLSIEDLTLDENSLKTMIAKAELRDGKISLKGLSSPLERLRADVRFLGGRLELTDLSCQLAGGSLKASASLDQWVPAKELNFQGHLKDLSLALLFPVPKGSLGLTGSLSLDFEGKAQEPAGPAMIQTLSGHGRLMLKDGVLLNYNLLRGVVDKLAGVPVLGDVFLQKFPAEFKTHLEQPSTILKPLEAPFLIEAGKIEIPDLKIETELLDLQGSGNFGFDKSVRGRAVLRMGSALSQALVKSSELIRVITNAEGRVEISVILEGVVPKIVVLPDIQDLSSKMLKVKAQEAAASLMQDPAKGLSNLFGKDKNSS